MCMYRLFIEDDHHKVKKVPQKSHGISWKNADVQLLLEVKKEEAILFSLDNARMPKEKMHH